jgi:hypothetical protein
MIHTVYRYEPQEQTFTVYTVNPSAGIDMREVGIISGENSVSDIAESSRRLDSRYKKLRIGEDLVQSETIAAEMKHTHDSHQVPKYPQERH